MPQSSRFDICAFVQRPRRFDASIRTALEHLTYARPGWKAEVCAEDNGDEWAAIVNRSMYHWTAGLVVARRGYVRFDDGDGKRRGVFTSSDDLARTLLAFVDACDTEAEEEVPDVAWGDLVFLPPTALYPSAKVVRSSKRF